VEREKIALKQKELQETVARLKEERVSIERALPEIDSRIGNLSTQITAELPDVRSARSRIGDLVAARERSQHVMSRFETLERLQELRKEIVGDGDFDSVALIAASGLDTVLLDELCRTIEEILIEWQFPGQRVFFDPATRDIQVSGKARRANGKGVRAVLHAAFSLGLLLYTFEKSKTAPPTPGSRFATRYLSGSTYSRRRSTRLLKFK
jgi:hypothetical protein